MGLCLLNGCDAISQYRISEQQINRSLQSHNRFRKHLGVAGIAQGQISLDPLHADIGHLQPGKIVLTLQAKFDIASLFGNQHADVALTFSAQPNYQAKQRALFLNDIAIISAKTTPPSLQRIIGSLQPQWLLVLNEYLAAQPAYVLSSDHSHTEAIAQYLVKDIQVLPGEIVIHLAL